MLKFPVSPVAECSIWKLVVVLVMVKVAAAKGEAVPACDPIVVIEPDAEELALQREAVRQGSPEELPLTQMMKEPKVGRLVMLVAVSVIAIGK